MKPSLGLIAALAISMLATTALADAPALPSYDDLKQMFNDKQYQPLLQKLAAIFQLHGAAAANYDPYQLYMLKGETHVQLKRSDTAIMAFNDAAKIAEERNKQDDIAIARAMAEAVKKSPGMVYKHINSPDKAHPETFDLMQLDPDKRKAAFAAVFDDEMTAAQPRLKSAMSNSKSVKPVFDFAKSVGPLRLLELAATGATKKCDDVLGGLATHAQDVISQTITQMDKRADEIKADADKVITITQPPTERNMPATIVYKRNGLTTAEANDLKSIGDTCADVPAGGKVLAEALGDPGGKFATLGQDADKLAEKAKGVLNEDYTTTASSASAFH